MKRFFENTLMSRAFSKALRVVALLCVLLGVSTSVWADELNSSYKGKSIYVAGSFNSWSTSAWKLSTTDNNYYSGEFTIAGQSDNYTFKIYSEGKYFAVDGYWFTSSNTTATNLVTDNNNMQIDCISESGNISVKFELYCEYPSYFNTFELNDIKGELTSEKRRNDTSERQHHKRRRNLKGMGLYSIIKKTHY